MQKMKRQAPTTTPTHERKSSIDSETQNLSTEEFEKALREALEALQLNNEEQAKPKISSVRKPVGNAAADVKPRSMKRKHMDEGDDDKDKDKDKDCVRRHYK